MTYNSTYTGILQWKSNNYLFIFDKKLLKLIPSNLSINYVNNRKVSHHLFSNINTDCYIGETFLIGHCFENTMNFVFIVNPNDSFSTINELLTYNVKYYYVLNPLYENIDRIQLSGKEINRIFPLKETYAANELTNTSSDVFVESISIRNPNLINTPIQTFSYKGKEIKVCFSFGYNVGIKNEIHPISLNSYLYLEFDTTSDYIFILDLLKISMIFIQFVCHRRNINIDSVSLSSYDNSISKFQCSGNLFTEEMHAKEEDYDDIKENIIKANYLGPCIGTLFQSIADKKLYYRHIPHTNKKAHIKDESSFILTVSAFDWEYRELYGHKEHQKVKMKYKISQAAKEFDCTIGMFGKRLYKNNNQELDYDSLGERLAKQRNNFAHGNLDSEFVRYTLIDLTFVEYLIYAMQLRKIGLPNETITKAINDLFGLHT